MQIFKLKRNKKPSIFSYDEKYSMIINRNIDNRNQQKLISLNKKGNFFFQKLNKKEKRKGLFSKLKEKSVFVKILALYFCYNQDFNK